MRKMLISFIIPTLNSEKYLDQCLNSILGLDNKGDEVEIIIVDNGSTDSTLTIAKKYTSQIYINRNSTIAGLRNIGFHNSEGALVGFIDSDVILDKKWLYYGKKIFQDDSIGITGGLYGLPENPTWLEKIWYESKCNIEGDVSFISSGTMIIKRDVFLLVDGFNEKLITGEDYDLCQRVINIGLRVYRSNDIKNIHYGNPDTLKKLFKKERWYGLGMFKGLKNNILSKPLVIVALNIIFSFLLAVTIITNNFQISFLLLFCIIFLPLIMSYKFISAIKKQKLKAFLYFIPISFIYIGARSVSFFDFLLINMSSEDSTRKDTYHAKSSK